ncbi:hypothetical protein PUN28_002255 [Cardiocondyla obscurior]|uniref:Uncharacterized protein n=1 Tax=Cardiocondyla obscurior TaxID=286306 RepID=A0AAW2GT99_9HYME
MFSIFKTLFDDIYNLCKFNKLSSPSIFFMRLNDKSKNLKPKSYYYYNFKLFNCLKHTSLSGSIINILSGSSESFSFSTLMSTELSLLMPNISKTFLFYHPFKKKALGAFGHSWGIFSIMSYTHMTYTHMDSLYTADKRQKTMKTTYLFA